MSATLRITAGNAGGRTFTANNGEASVVCSFQGLKTLRSSQESVPSIQRIGTKMLTRKSCSDTYLCTSAQLDSLAFVGLTVPIEKINIFQMMSPEAQSTGTCGFAIVAFGMSVPGSRLHGNYTHSWPVFRITSRMLFFVANSMPAAISEGSLISIA